MSVCMYEVRANNPSPGEVPSYLVNELSHTAGAGLDCYDKGMTTTTRKHAILKGNAKPLFSQTNRHMSPNPGIFILLG